MAKINVMGIAISHFETDKEKFISLTDIARHRDSERSDYILQNWLRTKSTIEFIGLWEKFNNPVFNSIEFDGIKNSAGSNSFSLTPKRWIESTNSIGIISKSGRYGGTFAHVDIAFEFASWISPEFKLYLITEFKRLKENENTRLNLDWDLKRTISKINYRIHTDAIKDNIIPREITRKQVDLIYANEADLLNVALFGMTAKEWQKLNSDKTGNIRDEASIEQLVILSNMESINALLISQHIDQPSRIIQLNQVAIMQMKSLLRNVKTKQLEKINR